MATSRVSRLSISSIVLMLAGLAVAPVAAAADGYNVVTLNAECRGFAGNGWHTYQIRLKAKIVARGTTPANYLQIRSVAQRQRNDGSWLVVERLIPDASSSFTPDGTDHSLQFFNEFTLPTTDERYGDRPHRLKFTLTAYDGNTLLFKEAVSKTCVN